MHGRAKRLKRHSSGASLSQHPQIGCECHLPLAYVQAVPGQTDHVSKSRCGKLTVCFLNHALLGDCSTETPAPERL
jgi:hypothetical protein